MAGSQANRTGCAGHTLGLAVLLLALGVRARAQAVRPPGPSPSNSSDFNLVDQPDAPPATSTASSAWQDADATRLSDEIRAPSSIFNTIGESFLGKPDPGTWRPLSVSTLFSEGWNEAWVPSPRGSGGAPRQGWINAAAGNLYRGCFATFAYGANDAPKGNAYLGSYTLMAPLSRRMMFIANVPFVLRNNADSGLPTIDPTGQLVTTSKSHTGFGDLSITPRMLLHETKDFSLTSELTVLTPTGHPPIARKTALTPGFSFWNNFAGRWVVRGGVSDLIPARGGDNTLISQLAIGHTLTAHDAPLVGDLTYYVSAVANTPLVRGEHNSVTLTPGLRTHLGRDWYLLAGLPTPLTTARVGDVGMILWIVKAW
jgi:hypothetical protein